MILYFAGAEVEKVNQALLDNGVKNILYSFYYIHLFGRYPFIERMIKDHPDVNMFLDSGAYTFSRKGDKTRGRFGSQENYLKSYFKFIDLYGHGFRRIAEPDFDVAGMEIEEVADLREEMLSRWPHLPIMPTYHPWREREEWLEYCEDPRVKHLAVGMGEYTPGELRWLCNQAHDHGKTVHGFGMTKIRTDLRSVPFDSVDSSTWLQGQRYGTMFVFQGNTFQNIHSGAIGGKENRRRYKEYFKGIGCDFAKILADDLDEVRKANIIAWRNLAERLVVMRKYQTLDNSRTATDSSDDTKQTTTLKRREEEPGKVWAKGRSDV